MVDCGRKQVSSLQASHAGNFDYILGTRYGRYSTRYLLTSNKPSDEKPVPRAKQSLTLHRLKAEEQGFKPRRSGSRSQVLHLCPKTILLLGSDSEATDQAPRPFRLRGEQQPTADSRDLYSRLDTLCSHSPVVPHLEGLTSPH